MPRAIHYPKPWQPTGAGSYRELRAGVFEIYWRRDGLQKKKRVPCSEQEARDFLAAEGSDSRRRSLGMVLTGVWQSALSDYETRLVTHQRKPKYITDVMATLKAIRDHSSQNLEDLTADHIEHWLEATAIQAQDDGRPGWARTTNKKRAMANAFFLWLFKKRRILQNPVMGTEIFKQTKKAKRNLRPDEYARLWQVCEPTIRDMLDFLLLTGCRFGEAAAMKRSDVSNTGVWTITERKGKTDLQLDLSGLLFEIFLRQASANDDGLVWHRWVSPQPKIAKGFEAGKKIDVYWFTKVMQQRCAEADVPPITAHDLRHAAGSWASENDANMRAIQALLGHSKLSTTELYVHGQGTHVAKSIQNVLLKVRSEAIQVQCQQ